MSFTKSYLLSIVALSISLQLYAAPSPPPDQTPPMPTFIHERYCSSFPAFMHTAQNVRKYVHDALQRTHRKHFTVSELKAALEFLDEDPVTNANVLSFYTHQTLPKAD